MPPLPQEDTVAVPLPVDQGIDIAKVMKSEGPIVDAVVLSAADNAVKAIRLDTTPKNQMVAKTLGGPFTFLGQYEDEGLMIMVRRDPDDNLPTNPHKLQPPFNETTVKGDILLLKVAPESPEEENSEVFKPNEEFFLSYTKEEYEVFAARKDIVAVTPSNSEEAMDEEDPVASGEEEEDDEEVEGEDDSEDEDEAGGFMAMLMGNVLQRFEQDNGRQPNEEELKALESAISEKLGGMGA
ncbi:unnamed protein product [Cylindrotheca closterium]|uniref:DUF5880 domain-containing protein n=1 Tax=Cylindrotheca closterium TaxID=2856 RepID=A0AAD2FIG7_9STRA|nr:unnamed protein product [Cylindrotheca closterium]